MKFFTVGWTKALRSLKYQSCVENQRKLMLKCGRTLKVIHGYLVRAKLLSTLRIHSHVTKPVRLERFRRKPFGGMAQEIRPRLFIGALSSAGCDAGSSSLLVSSSLRQARLDHKIRGLDSILLRSRVGQGEFYGGRSLHNLQRVIVIPRAALI